MIAWIRATYADFLELFQQDRSAAADEKPTTATAALQSFHALMRPEERVRSQHKRGAWVALWAAPLLPVALVLVVAIFTAEPPHFTPGSSLSDEIAALEERVENRLTAAAADDLESLEGLYRLATDRAVRETGSVLSEHQAYRTQILLIVSVIVLCVLCIALAREQITIVERHAGSFWPDPLVWKKRVAATGFVLGSFGLLLVPHALPWLFDSKELGTAGLLLWIVGAVPFTLVFCALYIGAFLTRLLACNFPDVASEPVSIEDIRSSLQFPDETDNGDEATQGLEFPQPDAAEPVAPEATALSVFESGDVDFSEDALVDREMGVVATTKVINAAVVNLGVVLVTAVVVVALAMDFLEAGIDGAAEFRVAITASDDAWLLVLGVGFSLALAWIYVPAMVRLVPYASALADQPAAENEDIWIVKCNVPLAELRGDIDHAAVTVTVARPDSTPPLKFPLRLECYLGANANKFREIMQAATYGAGFHSLVQDTLKTQIARILGLLAPALVGGALTFLG